MTTPHGPARADLLRDPRAEAVLSVMRAVRSFGDAHDRMSSDLRHRMEMNATDVAALRLLIIREEEGKPVSPHEIAEHLRISTASTSKLLDRLTRSGHVRRGPHPSDRRGRIIELTEDARRDFFRTYGPWLVAIRESLAGFDEEELESAVRVIAAVSDALDPTPSRAPRRPLEY